ncbi:hypothetical protein [Actinoallomurus sp. CA-150999]|uniref:hypothetical protein n=1 Tax=Actinoallomurus sp. CA-150999 TaxID=3239887 RepID=UPI003D93BFCD
MVLVVVVVALAGGVWLATRGGGDRSNEAPPPVRFRNLPGACSFVPDRTVEHLVPKATTDDRPNERTRTQALASKATLQDMRSAARDIVEALNSCTACGH